MGATRAGCGPPRDPSRRPREKDGNAQGPANRDGENAPKTLTTIVTPTRVNNTTHRPITPDSPVDEAEKLLPGAETSRLQISPASREHLQLSSEHHRRHVTSPRSTERLPQSYGDQHSHAGPSDSESEISWAQRALDEAKELSTKPTRPCFGERNADGLMRNVDAVRITPSIRRGPLLARRPAR